MPEDDAGVASQAPLVIEPRSVARERRRRLALELQIDPTFRGAHSDTREHIDREADPLRSREVVAPHVRLVSIHMRKQTGSIPAQGRLHLPSQLRRTTARPLRYNSGVHQQVGSGIRARRLQVCQRPVDQPVEQLVAIRRAQNLIECVGSSLAPRAVCDCKQMQVMIAEHNDGVVSERPDVANDLERARPAVYEIADEPELIAVGGEAQASDELEQFSMAPLHVTDRITGHCKIPGLASRKAAMGASKLTPSSVSIW